MTKFEMDQMYGDTEDIKDVKDAIIKLSKIMSNHERILRGDRDSDEPGGLIHHVYQNSSFRKVVTAWLWLLTGAVTTIGAQIIWNIINSV